ncbi:dynein assembly factor 3, axonemal-like [Anneissia japonica]|uniref:dynein assembly factor 3, axonemal-like n=1 Tax=Anneissia japonica TaxID=1529436 RepID=UPI001425511F|nr:dynein assembly factor 3, axonemal-like [Anneissia japonica]
MTDAFGAITWWGFSPAIDFQEKDTCTQSEDLKLDRTTDSVAEELNMLLVGAGDVRHVLKTISRAYRHTKKQLNFYIIENSLELLARQMLLLSIVTEVPNRMGLQEKMELFLEVFGNSLVRQQTSDYIIEKANLFIKMVTDPDFLASSFPELDMSSLKFKERDQLEAVFKFWRNPDNNVFDISVYWDNRVRKHMEQRYDSRHNCFDWDYNMKLRERGASVINSKQYGVWRDTGVAFEARDGTYEISNKTLASGLVLKQGGVAIKQRGYWGDIMCSPYLAYGIESENKELFKTANGTHTRTAADISEFNILSLLHELSKKENYVPQERKEGKEQSDSATLTEITEEDENEGSEDKVDNGVNDNENTNKNGTERIALENVKIYFLPLGSTTEIHKKSKYKELFNLVYLSNSMVHNLNESLKIVMADGATLVLETAKFMLELTEEQYTQFVNKVTGMAQKLGCKPSPQCDAKKDSFSTYTFLGNR